MSNVKLYLTRVEAAAALTEAGFAISRQTLAGMAAGRGHGPVFRRFGRKTLYNRAELFDWAAARMGAPTTGSPQ